MNSTAYAAATATGAAARLPSGWGGRLRRLSRDLRLLAHDHAELAVLEAQRAGHTLVRTLVAAVAISVLAATAWLALVAALLVWITEAGLSWPVALLIGAATCLAIAGLIGWWVAKHADEMMFSATLRQLQASKQAVEAEL